MGLKLSHRLHHLPLSQFFLHNPKSSNSPIRKSRKRTSLPEPAKSLPENPVQMRGKSHGMVYKTDSPLDLRQVITTPTCVLLHAKTRIGYFLVLGTLLAFCIGFVISLVRGNAARDSEHKDSSKPKSKSRWKHVLQETSEPDSSVSESTHLYAFQAEQSTSADEDQYPSADAHEYRKLERDYQRFLYECGARGGKLEKL